MKLKHFPFHCSDTLSQSITCGCVSLVSFGAELNYIIDSIYLFSLVCYYIYALISSESRNQLVRQIFRAKQNELIFFFFLQKRYFSAAAIPRLVRLNCGKFENQLILPCALRRTLRICFRLGKMATNSEPNKNDEYFIRGERV